MPSSDAWYSSSSVMAAWRLKTWFSGLAISRRVARWLIAAVVLLAATAVLAVEARTSRLQAKLFASFDTGTRIEVEPGPNPTMSFPDNSPYDERLGYTRLAASSTGSRARAIGSTARRGSRPASTGSPRGASRCLYREKTQAGLAVVDRDGKRLYATRYPQRVYDDFEAVPSLVEQCSVHREPRAARSGHVFRNPAVDWDRLATAGSGAGRLGATGVERPGEHAGHPAREVRHSPDGRTRPRATSCTR